MRRNCDQWGNIKFARSNGLFQLSMKRISYWLIKIRARVEQVSGRAQTEDYYFINIQDHAREKQHGETLAKTELRGSSV